MKKTIFLLQLLKKNKFVILMLFSLFMFSCDEKDKSDNTGSFHHNGDIAFASDRGGTKRIYLMDENGQNLRQVTDDAVILAPGEDYYSPAFSWEGKRIAFVVYPSGAPPSVQIGIGTVNIDGSGKKLLGSGVPDLQFVNQVSAPTWDDVGNVFFAAGDPNALYYYKHDNGGILRVNAEWCFAMYGCSQYFSPAAYVDMVVSHKVIFGTDNKIIEVNYMTETVQTLWDFGKNQNPNYDWRGQNIVTSDGRDIFEIMLIGGDPNYSISQLTRNAGLNTEPVFSPDGLRIAFTSNRDGNYEIYVMDNGNGGNQTNLTNSPGDDWGPTWAKK